MGWLLWPGKDRHQERLRAAILQPEVIITKIEISIKR